MSPAFNWRKISKSLQSQIFLASLFQAYVMEAILGIVLFFTTHQTPVKESCTNKLAIEQ
jgi:hypothetical protein